MAKKVVNASLILFMMLAGSAHALFPTIVNDSFTGPEDTLLTGNVLANDAPGDPSNSLSVYFFSDPGTGTFTLVANGSMTFMPDPDQHGSYLAAYAAIEDDPFCILFPIVPDCVEVGLIDLIITPVNDQPFDIGNPGPILLNEDDTPLPVSLSPFFDDVDIATDGQTLSWELVSAGDPSIIATATVGASGPDQLEFTLVPDAAGTTSISVLARDNLGLASAPMGITIIVTSQFDDVPNAVADTIVNVAEDSGPITIPVLANDYLEDAPTTITYVADPGTHEILDLVGDPQAVSTGTTAIMGTDIVYTPAPNAVGDVTFDYTITDADGDPSTATVSISIDPSNDAPQAFDVVDVYKTYENADLVVDMAAGLLAYVYDIDHSVVDSNGDPIYPTQTLTINFTTFPPAAEGTLVLTGGDGSFTFRPATGFSGFTSFGYTVTDDLLGTSTEATVEIEVFALPPAGAPPAPGEVAVLFNLSNTPLEQASSVEPNVLVTMDDSGSMDWNITVNSTDDNGRFVINNGGMATSNVRERLYTYLWNLNTNAYGGGSGCCGRILPSEQSLPAGNDYNVWQARSSSFNNIYYNPGVTYEPWSGLDSASVDFANADPGAVRLDPVSAANTLDITTRISYTATSVPEWDTNGGASDIAVTNYLIPRYYTAAGVLVEIEANVNYAGGPEREDCSDPAGPGSDTCTLGEELQNFANWFQYYRSREHVSKAAIGSVAADLQDIRVGYETINRRSHEEVAPMNEYYWEGEKKELLDTIYNVSSSGGTPLRRALDDAGTILGCNHGSRACPQLPAPEGICQQNFTLLFSDGYWNGSASLTGNHDDDGPGVWDGGKYADSRSSTLADVAMFYYENDLHTSTDDGVPVSQADIDGAPTGTFPSQSALMHQHMKTYTIAFGVTGTIVVEDAEDEDPTGSITWPDPNGPATGKVDDMLHAALNGRGRFLNAGDAGELRQSIETAFLEFTQAASSVSAAAFNSTSLRSNTLLYRGFYDLRNRNGELTATAVDAVTGDLAATPTWKAAELLDATHPSGLDATERNIATWDAQSYGGVALRHALLNGDQTATLNANDVDYMRGERTFEEPGGTLRARELTEGLLGDIVNSSPVFVGETRAFNRDQEPYPTTELYSDFADSMQGRKEMVYVGANDGMLHGFDAQTGVEQMAFMPNMVIDSTARFSQQAELVHVHVLSARLLRGSHTAPQRRLHRRRW